MIRVCCPCSSIADLKMGVQADSKRARCAASERERLAASRMAELAVCPFEGQTERNPPYWEIFQEQGSLILRGVSSFARRFKSLLLHSLVSWVLDRAENRSKRASASAISLSARFTDVHVYT